MPLRLCLVLVASCLAAPFAECAAPFVWNQPTPDSAAASGVDCIIGDNGSDVRRQFMEPVALPIFNSGPRPPWAYPYDREVSYSGCIPVPNEFRPHSGLADLSLLQPPEVHPVSLPSRRVTLSIDTAGIGKWDTALVELWITLDGWNWHLYQNSSPCDSLAVSLPGEGRYGLRIVVHDLNGHASATPRTGDAAQVWVDVNDRLVSNAEGFCHWGDGPWVTINDVDFLYPVEEFDQPADVKQARLRGLFSLCGYIKRVEPELTARRKFDPRTGRRYDLETRVIFE